MGYVRTEDQIFLGRIPSQAKGQASKLDSPGYPLLLALEIAVILLAVLVFLATALNAADKPERHMAGNAVAPLCWQSAFAHGFMHGYENGFRRGDGDYQMGRTAQDPRTLAEFKDSAAGYHSEFGDKERFRRGYREGFLSAYADSMHNRSFRAFGAAKIAAAGMEPSAQGRREFDAGFASGYDSLHPQPPMHNDAKSKTPDCKLEAVQTSPAAAAFCDGYRRGRQFAFFAAPIEEAQPGVQTASRQ